MMATLQGSRRGTLALIGSLALVIVILVPAPASSSPATDWVSISNTGAPANGDAFGFSEGISKTGRFVAFASIASNLVENDDNGMIDVFVHDRRTITTTIVSLATDGTPGNDGSLNPAISADGRYVAFESFASDLIAADTNGTRDVFVRDRQSGTTTRVSVTSDGSEVPTHGGGSIIPSISPDGRYVVFNSESPDLVPNDTNGEFDVFVHDRETSKTKRVSVRSNGAQGNSISAGGTISGNNRFVGFFSRASNLVPGDTNGFGDVFVHDRRTGKTKRVSVRSSGAQSNEESFGSAMSANGRLIAFYSRATNLVPGDTNGFFDVFIHDRKTGKTTRESLTPRGRQSNLTSLEPSLSADGRYVAFSSDASNLVPNDTNDDEDIFVRDLVRNRTRRVNLRQNGRECNGAFFGSEQPFISADGRFVVFHSDSTDLVPADDDTVTDVFVTGPLH